MQEKTLEKEKTTNKTKPKILKTNQSKRLKYDSYDIVFQEVPGEIALAINTTGCPHKCEGCHSSHLQEYYGNNLVDDIDKIIKKYIDDITCVCFMGGERYVDDMRLLLKKISEEYELKICIYSGEDTFDLFDDKYSDYYKYIDYLKIGSYKAELGGLDSPKTNQVFFQINTRKEKSVFFYMNEYFRKKYSPPEENEKKGEEKNEEDEVLEN